MEADNKTSKIHPLFATAAIALIAACLAGVASMMGILPNFNKTTVNESITSSAPAVTVAAVEPSAPAIASVPVVEEPPAPVAKKPVPKKVAPKPAKPAPVHANAQTNQTHRVIAPPPCSNCGIVESVRGIQQEGQSSGLGAGVGAVLGGVLGNQVGSGNGRTLATVAGALGGGLAGNAVEKHRQKTTAYEVVVQMENGGRERFVMNEQRWRSGDAVRVINGRLSPRDY